MKRMDYKGYTIKIYENSVFVVKNGQTVFNQDGYASESAAKSAISKHIKAQEEKHNAFWDDVSMMARQDSEEEYASKAA